MRGLVRACSSVLLVAGVLLLLDAALTVVWKEPLSALYALRTQDQLGRELAALSQRGTAEHATGALATLRSDGRRMTFLARALRSGAPSGGGVARLRIPAIGAEHVVVDGTRTADLRRGPGFYEGNPLPGARGTVAIAGHRTTFGAPFREIDDLARGDAIDVETPYGRFSYRVEKLRIVKPTDVWVARRRSYDRLILTACHPLYSAALRIVVFARLVRSEPRGAALARPA